MHSSMSVFFCPLVAILADMLQYVYQYDSISNECVHPNEVNCYHIVDLISESTIFIFLYFFVLFYLDINVGVFKRVSPNDMA